MSKGLLERVAAGDASAVDECLREYGGLVWSIARRFTVVLADAEDAVQDVFIDLWRSAGRFDASRASEATFVSTIARRRLIDRYRKRSRGPDVGPLSDSQGDAVEDWEDRVELSEEAARARKGLEQLRPAERQVLEMSIYDGLSHRRIAEATQLPLGTVKTHARRGLMRLREMLGADEELGQDIALGGNMTAERKAIRHDVQS